ncbi:MAG: hypothetical protein RIS36_510 [Pseudomonadota bacterium]|jgi:hypothetical protein
MYLVGAVPGGSAAKAGNQRPMAPFPEGKQGAKRSLHPMPRERFLPPPIRLVRSGGCG